LQQAISEISEILHVELLLLIAMKRLRNILSKLAGNLGLGGQIDEPIEQIN
jgi:hypothetical protein